MKEEDIEIVERDSNISPKDSILAKKDFAKRRTDLCYFDVKNRIRHVEVEFSYPVEEEEIVSGYYTYFNLPGSIPRSKEILKHQVEQFCFNNPGVEATYTGYED